MKGFNPANPDKGFVAPNTANRTQTANPAGYIPPLKAIRPAVDWISSDLPERRWLVPDAVPMRQATLIGGDGGTGKTLLAQQLMTSVALGEQWMGMSVAETGPVMGFFAEDEMVEVRIRQAKIMATLGLTMADAGDIHFYERVDEENDLMMFDRDLQGTETQFYYQICKEAERLKPKLIVLDSLYDFFTGNTNIPTLAHQFGRMLKRIARTFDTALVITTHPSRSGALDGSGHSGTVAWSNVVRARWFMSKPDDEPATTSNRILSNKKLNYGPGGISLRLHFNENGVLERTVEETGFVATLEKQALERAFVDCLHRLLQDGFEPSHSPAARGNYAPKMMLGNPAFGNATMKQIEKAMLRALHNGDVVLGKTPGPPSRAKKILVPKGHPLALPATATEGE